MNLRNQVFFALSTTFMSFAHADYSQVGEYEVINETLNTYSSTSFELGERGALQVVRGKRVENSAGQPWQSLAKDIDFVEPFSMKDLEKAQQETLRLQSDEKFFFEVASFNIGSLNVVRSCYEISKPRAKLISRTDAQNKRTIELVVTLENQGGQIPITRKKIEINSNVDFRESAAKQLQQHIGDAIRGVDAICKQQREKLGQGTAPSKKIASH